jgi:hypothetical protein
MVFFIKIDKKELLTVKLAGWMAAVETTKK